MAGRVVIGQLGGISESGSRCAYADAPGKPICGRPGVTHHLVGETSTPGYLSGVIACERHFEIANSIARDWHAVGGHCGVQGTRWHPRTETTPSYCEIDSDETDAEFAALAEEVHA